MKIYHAEASIDASPERIWALLTDAANYPAWESGVERVEGHILPGATIKVFSEVSPGRAFPVKVTAFEAPTKMCWSGGMPLGLFKGERTFTLTPGTTGTRFVMREEYSGPLLRLMEKSMPDLQPSFDKFTTGLKQRAEAK